MAAYADRSGSDYPPHFYFRMNVSKHVTAGHVGVLPFYPPSSYLDANFCLSVIQPQKNTDKDFREMV